MARGMKGKDRADGDAAPAGGFEASIERLEEIVGELEGSEVPLERALALFEEGVVLGRSCRTRLDEAERRITMLLEQVDGSLVEEPHENASRSPREDASRSPRENASRAPRESASRSPRENAPLEEREASPARGAAARPASPRLPLRPAAPPADDDDDGIPF